MKYYIIIHLIAALIRLCATSAVFLSNKTWPIETKTTEFQMSIQWASLIVWIITAVWLLNT